MIPRMDDTAEAKLQLDAVMHFVDKWFDDDDPRLESEEPAQRANLAREIALKWGEKLEAERDATEAKCRSAVASDEKNWALILRLRSILKVEPLGDITEKAMQVMGAKDRG